MKCDEKKIGKMFQDTMESMKWKNLLKEFAINGPTPCSIHAIRLASICLVCMIFLARRKHGISTPSGK